MSRVGVDKWIINYYNSFCRHIMHDIYLQIFFNFDFDLESTVIYQYLLSILSFATYKIMASIVCPSFPKRFYSNYLIIFESLHVFL